MVTEAVLDWWFGFVNWLISSVPSSDLPSTAINLSWLTDMNYFIPISELFMIFVAFFALGGPMAGTSLVIWGLIGILRGGATKA